MAKKTRAARDRARLSAENRRAWIREARLRKKARIGNDEAIARKAIAREDDPIIDRIRAAMDIDRGHCALRCTQPHTELRPKADKLLTALAGLNARFLTLGFTDRLLNLLQTEDWVRPVEDWKPKGRGKDTQFRSLVEHLLCKYPAPHFLFRAFDLRPADPGTAEWLYFFSGVAGGGSAYKLAKEYIPTPMTKRMAHRFMQTTGKDSLLSNIRRVQVEEFVEEDPAWARRLHNVLMGTVMGRPGIVRAGEEFWATIIRWFSRQAMLDPQQVGPLIDYIAHARTEEENWSIQGRTVVSLTRSMEEWHGVLHKMRKVVGTAFEPSGYKALHWREKRTDKRGYFWTYRVEEILTTKKLADEGRSMKHCVYGYGRSIQSGSTAIWSLRKSASYKEDYYDEVAEKMKTRWVELGEFDDADRIVTIEVDLRSSAVVQVRGKMNRPAKQQESLRVAKWASQNNLVVRSRW